MGPLLPALLLAASVSAAPPDDCRDGAACFDGARARPGSALGALAGAEGVVADARGFKPAPRPAFTAAAADATATPARYIPNDPPAVTAEEAGSGVIAWLRSLFGGGLASLQRLTSLRVLERAGWNRLTPVHPFDPSRPGRMTIHHSAIARAHADTDAKAVEIVRRIQREHREREQYDDIAYNFLIDPSGRVIEGRGAEVQGSHGGRRQNAGNVGISLLGHLEREHPTRAQEDAVARLGGFLAYAYTIDTAPDSFLLGHRDLPNAETECPGRHAYSRLAAWRVSIRNASADVGRRASAHGTPPDPGAASGFLPGFVVAPGDI